MSRQGNKFGDALLSVIETAEQNDVPYDEIIEYLEAAVENVKEWKQEYEARQPREGQE